MRWRMVMQNREDQSAGSKLTGGFGPVRHNESLHDGYFYIARVLAAMVVDDR